MTKLEIARIEWPELFDMDTDDLIDRREELIAEMPDGDMARNWDGWDELAAIDEVITEVVFNEYFEGVGACDIHTTGRSADLATAMRNIVGDIAGVNWTAMAARRIQLDSEA